MEYTDVERAKQKADFCSLFGVDKSVVDNPEVIGWMNQAPGVLVEYEGTLPGETDVGRRDRMEMFEVLDGDLSRLHPYLRHLYPEDANLTKWALIFKVHNGISDIKSLLDSVAETLDEQQVSSTVEQVDSMSQNLNESNAETVPVGSEDVPQSGTYQNEVTDSPIDTSAEESELPDFSTFNETFGTGVGKADTSPSDSDTAPKQVVEPTVGVNEVGTPYSERAENQKENKSLISQEDETMAAGNSMNVLDQANQSTATTGTPALDALAGAAQEAGVGSNSALADLQQQAQQAQTVGGVAQQAVAKPVASPAMIKAAQAAFEETLPERIAWTKTHLVQRFVCANEPTSKRLRGTMGIVSTGDKTARDQTAKKMYDNFKTATGYNPELTTGEDGQPLPLSQKFPKVKDEDDLKKAEACLTLIQQMRENSMMEVPIYQSGKTAWSVKGVELDGTTSTNKELRDILMASSSGAVYCAGSLDANGSPISAAAVITLSNVKKKKPVKGSQGQAPTTGTTVKEQIDGVVRIKNKNTFIENHPEHILIVYPTIENPTEEQVKYVSINAQIAVGDKVVAAAFRYETGEMIKDALGKDVKPKTKTFSIKVRVQAAMTSAEPNPVIGDKARAAKFGDSIKDGASTIDYTDIEAVRANLKGKEVKGEHKDNAMITLFAAMAAGQTASAAESDSAKALLNQIKAKAEGEDAAVTQEAAEEMAGDLA